MLSHESVWAAVDALASRYGMTASGLARKAGLDATSFNKSKRTSSEGRERWPSTESISKILRATGASLEDFLKLVEPEASLSAASLPLVSTARTGAESPVSEGQASPHEAGERIAFPDSDLSKTFALEVKGHAFAPYKEGDVLIVSPSADLRKGDRVVIRTTGGELQIRELKRHSAKDFEFSSPTGGEDQIVPLEDVAWSARILWVRSSSS